MTEVSRFDEENKILREFLIELDAFVAKEKKGLEEMEEEYKQGVLDASIESKRNNYTQVLSQTMTRLLAKGAEDKIRYLEKIILTLNSPYFAKIKVAYEYDSKDFYIGRIAFTGSSEKYVITDWRAPVASLYYNNPFIKDDCEYKVLPINASDSGRVVKCDLKLRRAIEIENRKLIKVYDNSGVEDIESNEFLLKKLNDKTGGVLESITETIQKDQYEIIKANPQKNIIVQGVAGSGKTTLALHRLSYLLYNFPNLISPKNTLFLTNSKLLINYLVKSLNEFEISETQTYSFDELLVEILKDNKIISKKFINKQLNFEPKDVKEFMEMLETFVNNRDKELKHKLKSFIAKESLKFKYYDLTYNFEKLSSEPYFKLLINLIIDIQESFKVLRTTKREYKSEAQKEITKEYYRSKTLVKIFEKEFAKKNIKKFYESISTVLSNDLYIPGLFYFSLKLGALNKITDYDIVIVDEAQDFDVLRLNCLKSLSTRNRFNLFGDLNQALDRKNCVKAWSNLFDVFDSNRTSNFELVISYRSTKEITERAYAELKKGSVKKYLPIAVSRPHFNVFEKTFADVSVIIEDIKNKILEIETEKLGSVGVIVSDKVYLSDVVEALSYAHISVKEVGLNFDGFTKTGVFVIPAEYVKGLEFNNVFIVDFNSTKFSNIENGTFLRYVSVTRAINRLHVYNLSS